MRYCLVQLGCQMNISDGERIRTVLERMGFTRTEEEQEADLLGIVACSVRQKAIDKVYSKVARWNSWKHSRNLLTFVSGCILPSDREKFLGLFDLMFSINDLPELPDMIRQYGIVTPYSLQGSDEPYIGERESREPDGSDTAGGLVSTGSERGTSRQDDDEKVPDNKKAGEFTLSRMSLKQATPKRRVALVPEQKADDRST
ncbi:MAG: hypothetical protein ACOCRN_02620, partial [Spirochaetia bacterium]